MAGRERACGGSHGARSQGDHRTPGRGGHRCRARARGSGWPPPRGALARPGWTLGIVGRDRHRLADARGAWYEAAGPGAVTAFQCDFDELRRGTRGWPSELRCGVPAHRCAGEQRRRRRARPTYHCGRSRGDHPDQPPGPVPAQPRAARAARGGRIVNTASGRAHQRRARPGRPLRAPGPALAPVRHRRSRRTSCSPPRRRGAGRTSSRSPSTRAWCAPGSAHDSPMFASSTRSAPFLRTPGEGRRDPGLARHRGRVATHERRLLQDLEGTPPSARAADPALAARLWDGLAGGGRRHRGSRRRRYGERPA